MMLRKILLGFLIVGVWCLLLFFGVLANKFYRQREVERQTAEYWKQKFADTQEHKYKFHSYGELDSMWSISQEKTISKFSCIPKDTIYDGSGIRYDTLTSSFALANRSGEVYFIHCAVLP